MRRVVEMRLTKKKQKMRLDGRRSSPRRGRNHPENSVSVERLHKAVVDSAETQTEPWETVETAIETEKEVLGVESAAAMAIQLAEVPDEPKEVLQSVESHPLPAPGEQSETKSKEQKEEIKTRPQNVESSKSKQLPQEKTVSQPASEKVLTESAPAVKVVPGTEDTDKAVTILAEQNIESVVEERAEEYKKLLGFVLDEETSRERVHDLTLKFFKGAKLSELLSVPAALPKRHSMPISLTEEGSSRHMFLTKTKEEEHSPEKVFAPAEPVRKQLPKKRLLGDAKSTFSPQKSPIHTPASADDRGLREESFAAAAADVQGEARVADRIREEREAAEDEEVYNDHNSVKLEDPQTELPKKLMAAMTMMSDKIASLETDEYGEWLLDITKDTDLVNRIIKNGHLLTLLLRNLYRKKESQPSDADVRLYDMPTQTESLFTAEALQKSMSEGRRIIGDRIVADKGIQAAFIESSSYLVPHTPTAASGHRSKVYVYNEKKQLQSSAFTIVKPFNLGGSKGSYVAPIPEAAIHPGQVFLTTFVEKVERRDPKYLNVVPITARQLVKAISLIYGEKLNGGKETVTVRLEVLAYFLYDSYINKYGLLNVAERKLKELLLSVVLNRTRIHKVELFARFLGLSHIQYSADDLHFMFCVAQKLALKVTNASYVKQKIAVFELAKQATVEELVETLDDLLGGKLSASVMEELKKRIQEISKEGELDIDVVYTMLIERYREAKKGLEQRLAKLHVVKPGQELYDFREYTKIAARFELEEGYNHRQFFDQYATISEL